MHRLNDVVVLTTAFKQKADYTEVFFRSLAHQSHKEFDLLVVNDGCDQLTLMKEKYGINIIEIQGSGNPAKNREILIKTAINLGFIKAIFSDYDDFFSENRIECVLSLLNTHDMVVNELAVVSDSTQSKKDMMILSLKEQQNIFLTDVLESNFFGMTNTAINLIDLQNVNFPHSQIAVDWCFFSKLFLLNKTAIFTRKCVSYYRQHPQNISTLRTISAAQMEKELIVKQAHYEYMLNFDEVYKPLYMELKDFQQETWKFKMQYLKYRESFGNSEVWWDIFNLNAYRKFKDAVNQK